MHTNSRNQAGTTIATIFVGIVCALILLELIWLVFSLFKKVLPWLVLGMSYIWIAGGAKAHKHKHEETTQ